MTPNLFDNPPIHVAQVVSRRYQALAGCALVFLNVVFIYFAILRSYQKCHAWQLTYLAGCIVQVRIRPPLRVSTVCKTWRQNCLIASLFGTRLHARR